MDITAYATAYAAYGTGAITAAPALALEVISAYQRLEGFNPDGSPILTPIVEVDQALAELGDLVTTAEQRTRPDYTISIPEWDAYWDSFCTAKSEAGQLYAGLAGKGLLTPEEKEELSTALQGLKKATEILEAIEDFDLSFGDRQSPRGCETIINEQSRTESGGNRLRIYYEKESSSIYWLLSKKLQQQKYIQGVSGTGMKTGLVNILKSEALYQANSGSEIIEIYNEDGRRKNEEEIVAEGEKLASGWVDSPFGKFSGMVGKAPAFSLIGKTSDGAEFQRSYTFYFLDAGLEEFDPETDYCVLAGEVCPCSV